jgi:predicted aminopeptidase
MFSGCYYFQSAVGQLNVVSKSRSIKKLVNDDSTDAELKQKLMRAQSMRAFASNELGLPDNKSYKRYADIKRDNVVWNVFAVSELSVSPAQWCFPVVGCVVYRGYFSYAKAKSFGAKLEKGGFDVFVGGVPAYSTLGWFNDPLLNTVINYSDVNLAGLIFHELAHQVVFVKGDTAFNESFATAVELEGMRRWLQAAGDAEGYHAYVQDQRREEQVIELILDYRDQLKELYQSDITDEQKRQQKTQTFAELKQAYQTMRSDWPGPSRFDNWFAKPWNNAYMVPFAAYYDWVPAFTALLEENDGDLTAFYHEVERLAKLKPDDRAAKLDDMTKLALSEQTEHNA